MTNSRSSVARKDLAQAEWKLRQALRSSLETWCRYALAAREEAPARHHILMLDALERVRRSRGGRLMILMPPGAAKSTYASILFPAWFLARHQRATLVAASHTTALAEHFGMQVRGLIEEHGCRLGIGLSAAKRAAADFQLRGGGGYFGIGLHGAITGRRADLAMIDDPTSSYADIAALPARERLWNWYGSELLTRLRPGGRVVLVTTRWHDDDLAGRLIKRGGFEVLAMPALAMTGDVLGRQPGEALWPEYETAAELEAKRGILGEAMFSAVYQQAPLPAAGHMFAVDKLRLVDIVPVGQTVRAWDLAAASGPNADWTAGVRLVRDRLGQLYVDDVVRFRGDAGDLVTNLMRTAERDGKSVEIGLPQDPGQAGVHQARYLTAELAGYIVKISRETGHKITRAMPLAAQIAGGTVALRRASWTDVLMDELAAFPLSRHDDQVDALSRGFSMLSEGPRPARFIRAPGISR